MIILQTNTYKSSLLDYSVFNFQTNQLNVVFKGGEEYVYLDVSQADYTSFINSESHGSGLNKYIKQYNFYKINKDSIDGSSINCCGSKL